MLSKTVVCLFVFGLAAYVSADKMIQHQVCDIMEHCVTVTEIVPDDFLIRAQNVRLNIQDTSSSESSNESQVQERNNNRNNNKNGRKIQIVTSQEDDRSKEIKEAPKPERLNKQWINPKDLRTASRTSVPKSRNQNSDENQSEENFLESAKNKIQKALFH